MTDKPYTRKALRVDVVPEHPIFKWAYTMARAILNKWGMADSRVYFNNSQQPAKHQHRPGTFAPHRLWFRYPYMEKAIVEGMQEYKTFRWLWNGYSTEGLGAVWAIVMHELAHALQTERGQRYYGQVHNGAWASIVQDLQREYPLAKCMDLWLRGRQGNKVSGEAISHLLADLGQTAEPTPKVTKPKPRTRKPRQVSYRQPTPAEIAEALLNLGVGQRVVVHMPGHIRGKARLLDGHAGRIVSKGSKRCRVQFGKALGDKQWYVPATYLEPA